jgi:hypothetical protein
VSPRVQAVLRAADAIKAITKPYVLERDMWGPFQIALVPGG